MGKLLIDLSPADEAPSAIGGLCSYCGVLPAAPDSPFCRACSTGGRSLLSRKEAREVYQTAIELGLVDLAVIEEEE